MASVIEQRAAVKNAYPGKKWQNKVDRMPEDQIAAVYIRLKGQGKI